MAKIEVTIIIPDYEYKEWDEYRQDGVEMVMQSLRKEISDRLRQDYVHHFEIETNYIS
jgi:hypothetical protein